MRRKKKMRAFKTVIMDKTTLMTWTALLGVLILVYIGAICAKTVLSTISFTSTSMLAGAAMENIVPSWGKGDAQKGFAYTIFCKIAGFNPKRAETIIYSQISALKIVAENNELKLAE